MLRAIVALAGSARCMVAVRDAESRTRFLGYRVEHVKLFAFTLSAVMAGIAGALYVPQVGIINPGEFAPANSIEVVIWTAVGGRGTLIGPIIGALTGQCGQELFHRRLPGHLAVRARRAVRLRHAVPAQGHRRHAGRMAGEDARRKAEQHEALRQPPPPWRPPNEQGRIHCSISTASPSASTASRRSTTSPSSSARARCAPSSAPTAPARRR